MVLHTVLLPVAILPKKLSVTGGQENKKGGEEEMRKGGKEDRQTDKPTVRQSGRQEVRRPINLEQLLSPSVAVLAEFV